jgi:NADH-quinone oxidoreductase subunit N
MSEIFRACGTEIVLMAVAGLLIVAETLVPGRWGRSKGYLALLGVAGAFLPLYDTIGASPSLFGGGWASDDFAVVFKVVLLLASVLVIFMSIDEQSDDAPPAGEYYILTIMALLGMMVMVSGKNLIVIYLGLELMAISFYILAGFTWYREESSEGALKYVLTGLFASALLLYGISFLYGATGTIEFGALREIFTAGDYSPVMALVGVVFLTCGLAFKMGAVPFHMWMPDVLEGAPTPVAGFLAVGPKVAVLAVAARVFLVSLSPLYELWMPLLWTIAALTILWGNLAAIAQSSLKRMLAYSSIAHVGYLLIALVAAGRHQEEGLSAVAFYLVVYSFMNLGAFGCLLWFEKSLGEAVTWQGLAGIWRRAPAMAFLWSIFMFSLAGIPPTGGFIGKFWVLAAGWKAGLYGLVLIGIVGSAVGAYFYLRTIYAVYMLPEEGEAERMPMRLSPLAYAVVIAAAGVIVAGVVPQFFMVLAARAFPY